MDIEQKYMAGWYIQIKKELDKLIGDYIRSKSELTILKGCESALAEKLKTAEDELDKHAWKGIVNELFYKEFQEASQRERSSLKVVNDPVTRQKIDYLEVKLETVKKHLSPETLKIIENLEIEKMF